MTFIRVYPSSLRQSSEEIRESASSIEHTGSEISGAASGAPSYDGQFGPKVRGLGSEAQARAKAIANNLSALSKELDLRATRFETADQTSWEGLQGIWDKIIRLLGTFEGLPEGDFPLGLLIELLGLGGLLKFGGGGQPNGGTEEGPPWYAPFVIGLRDGWEWYDRHVNQPFRDGYQAWLNTFTLLDTLLSEQLFALQEPGLPADGPITIALSIISAVDASGDPVSVVGTDVVRLVDARGGIRVSFADFLTAGGTAGVSPFKGIIWLPAACMQPGVQEDWAAIIAHEIEHGFQRDQEEFPDGYSPGGIWPFDNEGKLDPLGMEYGAPAGKFTLYMEVLSNIVEKSVDYDLTAAKLAALPLGDPRRTGLENRLVYLADRVATYTGDAGDACAYVVEDHGMYGMYTGEMVKEMLLGEQIPPGGWDHWLRDQGFSEASVERIQFIASQGTPQQVRLGGMLQEPQPLPPTPPAQPVPTPPPTATPTPTGTPGATATTPSTTPEPTTPPASAPDPPPPQGGTPQPTPTPTPTPTPDGKP